MREQLSDAWILPMARNYTGNSQLLRNMSPRRQSLHFQSNGIQRSRTPTVLVTLVAREEFFAVCASVVSQVRGAGGAPQDGGAKDSSALGACAEEPRGGGAGKVLVTTTDHAVIQKTLQVSEPQRIQSCPARWSHSSPLGPDCSATKLHNRTRDNLQKLQKQCMHMPWSKTC